MVHVLHEVPEGAPVFTKGTELAEEFEEVRAREGEEVCLFSTSVLVSCVLGGFYFCCYFGLGGWSTIS